MYLQDLFLSSKQGLRSRRIDWLLHVILGELHAYYFHRECTALAGFGFNKAAEESIRKSVEKAWDIQDMEVALPANYGEAAFVKSASASHFSGQHSVTHPGTPEAGCSCVHFIRGNICKHIIKVHFSFALSNSPDHTCL